MKKLLSLVAILLMLTISIFAFASCTNNDKPDEPDVDQKPGTDPDGDGDNDNQHKDPVFVDLTFKNKTTNEVIKTLKVEKDSVITEEQLKVVDDIRYNGYGFAGWYTDLQLKKPFDFKSPVEDSATLYGDRGDLAGKNIKWSYDDETATLKIDGEGPMFNFQYNDDAPWVLYKSIAENIEFAGNITTIGNNAFYEFSAIKSVKLPDTIEKICDAAFYRSTLADINFPKSLKEIGVNAFYRCVNLTRLEFNPGLTYIGKSAFYECVGVTEVVLTDKIAELGGSAFYGAKNIKSAFYVGTKEQYDKMVVRLDNFWVQQLANTYYLSDTKPDNPGPYWHFGENGEVVQWYYTVGYLAVNATVPFLFDYVDPEVGVTKANIDFMNSITFHGYKFKRWDGKAFGINKYEEGLQLTSDIRLKGVRGNVCGDSMTWDFKGTTLTLKGTGRMWDFETSKDSPWYGRNITKVVIGKDIEYIGSYAFSSHTSLIEIDIPATIKSINTKAFIGCNELKCIYYLGDKTQMEAVEGLLSLENTLDGLVYCMKGKNDPDVGRYWQICNDELGDRKVAWEFTEDGKLTIGGNYSLVNYKKASDTPWYYLKDKATSVVIRKGANRIGAHTVEGFSKVTAIEIPETVMKIADSAFVGTAYYDTASNWVDGALYISKHLIKVNPEFVGATFTIKPGTLSIAENAFGGCSQITDLIFNKEMEGVYANALTGLTGLKKIFYLGTSMDGWNTLWSGINKAAGATINSSVVIYCYSKSEPDKSAGGNWWHYVITDGVEKNVIWETKTK